MRCQVSAAGPGLPSGRGSLDAGPAGGRGPRSVTKTLLPGVPPQVTVLYFARSAELAGLRSESVSVPQRLTSLQLWEEIVKIHPRYLGKALLRCTLCSVCGVFCFFLTNSAFRVQL